MRTDRDIVPLGNVIDIIIDRRGVTPFKLGSDWKDFGYKTLSARNVHTGELVCLDQIRFVDEPTYRKWMPKEIQKGDILITSEAPFGNVFYWNSDEKITLGQRLFAIRINKENDSRYIYYSMITDSFQRELLRRCSGSTVTGLRQPELLKCALLLPELSIQKKIGNILSTLDQRIENLRAQNRVLEQTAKTIYDYTFLQCAGHQTAYNKTLNRNIPADWEVTTIGYYIKESKGGDWGKENPEKNYNLQVSCIRGADIEKMTDLPIRYILAKNSSKLLQEFDLVVEISGGSPTQSTGRSRLMTKELLEMFDNKLICSNFCQAVTMKNPQYAYYISFMWKMFYDNGIFFNFEGKTSGIKNFQLDQFVDTMWFFPDLKTVEKFNAQVAPLIKKQLFNAKQIEALTTQRNTLLPLLMTGQIKV